VNRRGRPDMAAISFFFLIVGLALVLARACVSRLGT
jgi:hypothetical protein